MNEHEGVEVDEHEEHVESEVEHRRALAWALLIGLAAGALLGALIGLAVLPWRLR